MVLIDLASCIQGSLTINEFWSELVKLAIHDEVHAFMFFLCDGSAVDQFKKQFSHLESGGTTPLDRQHTSLPRCIICLCSVLLS